MEQQKPAEIDLPGLLREAASALTRSDNSVVSRAEIIYHGQKLLVMLPAGSERRRYVEAIGIALHEQYEAIGEWKMLEDAFELLDEAISETSDDDDIAASRLGNIYSQCLWSRFMRGRNPKDLENAIQFAKDAVNRTINLQSDNQLEWIVDRQNTLSLCYFTQAHQLDDPPDGVLEEAISISRNSVEILRVLDPPVKLWLTTIGALGMFLQVRWTQSHDSRDIEESIELGYQVLRQCPDQLGARGEALSNLAFRLQRGYNHVLTFGPSQSQHLSKRKVLLTDSLDLISQSTALQSESRLSTLQNILTYVLYIKEFPVDVQVEVLAKCHPMLKQQVELIKEIAVSSNLDDRKDIVQTSYGISRYAAAAAIEAGIDPYYALELLEMGRGLSMSLHSRSSGHYDLSSIDETLRDQYITIKQRLHQALEQQTPYHERLRYLEALQKSRSNIQSLSGFEYFDKFMSRDDLLELGNEGPIIVINVTDIRSHAIIIHEKTIRTIFLPDANEDYLSDRSWEIQQLLAREVRDHRTSHDLHIALSTFMKDLWKLVALPVLDDLGYHTVPEDDSGWPRVWWMLTGVLCLYPIQAAGVGLHSKKNNIMNRVISTNIPTLQALANARSEYRLLAAPKKHLLTSMPVKVITMTDTQGRASLEYAEKEGEEISKLFPTVEILANPSRDEVTQALSQEAIMVHFSCHGEVDYDFPWKSKFLLRDWKKSPLSVQDLTNIHQSSEDTSRVAFLSACFTANAGIENLQDEMSHFVTALQMAGYMCVVGTLWDVQQRSAFEVVRDFYTELARRSCNFDAKDVARILHFAVLRFRESTREVGNDMKGSPMIWAPFVSFGL